MPINLGNGLVTGNIILRTGNGGGGGGGGASVNVPANSILFSSTGTDICGNSGLEYDGNVATINILENDYLNTNEIFPSDRYFDNVILLILLGESSLSDIVDYSTLENTIQLFSIRQIISDTIFNTTQNVLDISGGGYIRTDINSIYNIPTTGGTIEFMFKITRYTTSNTSLFNILSASNINNKLYLQATTENIYLKLVENGVTTTIWSYSQIQLNTTWYYFALSITSNSSYKVYFGEAYPNTYAAQQTLLATPTLISYDEPLIQFGQARCSITNIRITNIPRYSKTYIPIPNNFYPKLSNIFNTNGNLFSMNKYSNNLGLFIGRESTNTSDIILGRNTLNFTSAGISTGDNIIIGNSNANNITNDISQNIIIGFNNITDGIEFTNQNISIGVNNNISYSEKSVLLGYNLQCDANVNNIIGNGSTNSGFSNCTILGNNINSCSGNNQNQIGGSDTTTYTYGAVQDRSDMRDKADIIDIPIGVNFINKLKPKFYRWNYREDYIHHDESGNEIQLSPDGSKKRTRLHAGLIAQDVKETMDELSIDFGVYQDHLVKGGKDVKSLGYAELIPVLIKAIQELSTKNTELENRLKILENK